MSRTSLISSRRRRAACLRPATDTRLLLMPFPDTVSPSHPTPGDGRSIDSTLHTSSRGYSRGYAPFQGHTAPATRQGLWPDFVGSPEAIAPRVYSPVASLGTPLSHSDGKEVTPDHLRTVESVWGSYPLLDSPVFPLGESPSPRDGRGSALPYLRMVERFPHTDRYEISSPPVPTRVWRRLAPRPVRPGHGPSIASPSLPTNTFHPTTQPPFTVSFRCPATNLGRGSYPFYLPVIPTPFLSVIPSLLPSTELEAEAGALAPASASVLISPSTLKALRERGIQGVRVPLRGRGASPYCQPVTPILKRFHRHRKAFPNPFRRHSIKLATNSINLQSRTITVQLRTINLQSSPINFNHHSISGTPSPPCIIPPEEGPDHERTPLSRC